MQELMRRLFWNRSVYRVRRSWKVKTGQSTTSFHPATGNPITTSTIYSPYVDHVMDESKTEYYRELHGATKGISRIGKPLWLRLLLVINDLLPLRLRPVKSKRAHRRRYLGLRHRIFIWRMHWRSHHKRKVKAFLRIK
jgi:hypothetical protein